MQTVIERLRSRRQGLEEKEGGFTLVELLIVIVILAILAAIIVFAVQSLQGKSAQASCQTDVGSVDHAVQSYYALNNVYPTSTAQLVSSGVLHNTPTNGSHYAIAMNQDVNAATPFTQGNFVAGTTTNGVITVLSGSTATAGSWTTSTQANPAAVNWASTACAGVS